MHLGHRSPPDSMLRLFIILGILGTISSPVIGQLNDNTVKGMASNHLFSEAFGDSVDTLSGQMFFTIGLGPSFSVTPLLSYQPTLVYTSKVWRYSPRIVDDVHHIDGRAQAGVGFYLQMGRIYWKWSEDDCNYGANDSRKLILQLADGAERDLSQNITTDLSFIKKESIVDSAGMPAYRVRTPTGLIYTFDHWVDDPRFDPANETAPPWDRCLVDGRRHDSRTSDIRGWYLTSINDPFSGKSVQVEYEDRRGLRHLMKRIHEPATGREFLFTNAACDSSAGLTCGANASCEPGGPDPNALCFTDIPARLPVGYVTEVRVPSFGRPAAAAGAATYRFIYEVEDTSNAVIRPPMSVPDPSYDKTLHEEVFLSRIEMPEGLQVTYGYLDNDTNEHIGVIAKRTMPSGAQVQYGYGRYTHSIDPVQVANYQPCHPGECVIGLSPFLVDGVHFPVLECSGTTGNCGDPPAMGPDLPATIGVAWKKVRWNKNLTAPFTESFPVDEQVWLWNRNFTLDPNSHTPLGNPYKVIVTDPLGNQKIHYFASSTLVADPNAIPDQYHLANWDDGLLMATEEWVGHQGLLVRSTSYKYEDDYDIDETGVIIRHHTSNRRVKSSTHLDYEGGPRGTRVVFDDWDGCGHYRKKTEYGFGNTKYRETTTGYNPGSGPGQLFPGYIWSCDIEQALNENWVLNTYESEEVRDASGMLRKQTDFSFGDDGKLRRRVDRISPDHTGPRGTEPTTLDGGDVVTSWYYYGDADCTSAAGCLDDPTGAQTGFLAARKSTLGNPALAMDGDYGVTFTYASGHYQATVKNWYSQVLAQDVDVDVNSGLTSVSRDPEGIPTHYEYDLMGRLTGAEPGGPGSGEAPITVSYPSIFTTQVRQASLDNPGQEVKADYKYDQLFRTQLDKRWMEDGRLVSKTLRHDAMGRKTFESEWGSATAGTTFSYLYETGGGASGQSDPLPRVHKITTADGSETLIQYLGPSTQVTITSLGESASSPFDSTTVYERDAFGRLIRVIAPQTVDPQVTSLVISTAANAEYKYDIFDNLLEVALEDPLDVSATPQRRFFSYDAMGRLATSVHPENGTESIDIYNALNLPFQRTDPAGNVHWATYDSAGRLTSTIDFAPDETVLGGIGLTYDNYSNEDVGADGKLRMAQSQSVVNGETITTKRWFEYEGLNGRLSRVRNELPGLDLTFSLEYDDLGLVKSVEYPFQSELGGIPTSLLYSHSGGLLTGILNGDQSPLLPVFKYNDAGGLSWMETSGEVVTEIVSDIMHRPKQILIGFTGDTGLGEEDPPGGGGGGSCSGPGCMPGLPGNYASSTGMLPSDPQFIGQSSPYTITYHDSGQYKYDSQGNIVRIGPERFLYDGSGRLRSALLQHPDLEMMERTYDYDHLGNMTRLAIATPGSSSSPLISRNFAINPGSNRMQTETEIVQGQEASAVPVGITYDSLGNVSSDGSNSMVFDENSRLIKQVSNGVLVSEYLYDHAGHRISKKHWPSDTETIYFRDGGGRVLSEFRRRISAGEAEPASWLRDHIYVGDRLAASIQDVAPEGPGRIRTAASDSGTPASITLIIDPSAAEDVTSYNILKQIPNGGIQVTTLPAASPGSSIIFQDQAPDVSEGSSYIYSVTAIDAALNESAPSRELTISPGDETPPPAPGVPDTFPGDAQISLIWQDPGRPVDHYGYHLYRRVTGDPDPAFQRVSSMAFVQTSFTDVGLDNDVQYDYYVASVDTAGNESAVPAGGIVTVAPIGDVIPPAPPSGLEANASTSTVELWWAPSPEPDVVSYRIERAFASSSDTTPCLSGPMVSAANPYFFEGGLPDTTDYFYRICAIDEDGNVSDKSAELLVKTRNANTPQLILDSVAFDNCISHNWYGIYDAAPCVLPGSQYLSGTGTYLDTPFSHLNYLEVTLGGQPTQVLNGFQLYRRRGTSGPWERVGIPVNFDDAWDGWQIPGWPNSQDRRYAEGKSKSWAMFEIDASTWCGTPYYYAAAGMTDTFDAGTEGALTELDPLLPPLAAPLPAPENLRVVGDPNFSLFKSPPQEWMYEDASVTVRWDSYKGACRPDYRGIRVFRQYDLSNDSTPTVEVTNGPVFTSGYSIPRNEIGFCSSYRFFALAVGEDDVSRRSNMVCSSTCATDGTCNGEPGCYSDNTYCDPYYLFPEDWEPEDDLYPSFTQTQSLTLSYAGTHYSGGDFYRDWRLFNINLPAFYGGRRIRVYRTEPAPGGPMTTLVQEMNMGARQFAINGWQPPDPSTSTRQANQLTECDPNVSYQVSFVDILGVESPLSAPVNLPSQFQFAQQGIGLVDTPSAGNTNNTVTLKWGPVPNCSESLVGYNIYMLDIGNAASEPCELPADPDSVATMVASRSATSIPTWTHVNPPGNNSNVLLYYVRAVGAPGDTSALSDPFGPLCTSANAVSARGLEAHPPDEDGWGIAENRGASPKRGWSAAPERFIGQAGPMKEILFYHADHLGTPVVITDAEGMVVSKHKYSPFGEELAPKGGNSHSRRFTGHERDDETGLDYMLARYYGPGMGRFLGVDPAADSVDLLNPQSWNRYSYTGNNPIRFIDPDGMHTSDIHEEIIDEGLEDVMSEAARGDVKRGNVAADTLNSFRDTSAEVQNQHGSGGTKSDGTSQTRQEAEAGTAAFASDKVGEAARNLLAGDVTSARENFGAATHAPQDGGADGHKYQLYTGVASTNWGKHRAQDKNLTSAERASGIDATRALHSQFTSTFRTLGAINGLDNKAISAALTRFNGQ